MKCRVAPATFRWLRVMNRISFDLDMRQQCHPATSHLWYYTPSQTGHG